MYFLLLILFAYVVLAILLRWREPSMIYFPIREMERSPERFADVYLTTSDGEKINGWFVQSLRANAPAVLFFHGNAGNISHRMDKLRLFQELGVDVLIIDYRGYGRSTGKPDEQGTYRDAKAAYDHLTKTLKRPPQTVIVYGESLGAAMAVDLATKVPVGGVILEEPFTSTGDVGQRMFPYMPVRWLVRNKYDNLAKMPQLKAPLLIFHSWDDEMFPLSFAQRLLSAAPSPKQLIELRGSHNDAFLVSATIHRQGLKTFLDNLTP
jgi:fermentation-respiration switch protein FrsA (DUF1100 family)